MIQTLIEDSALPLTLALAESLPGHENADLDIDRDVFAEFYDPKSQITAWPEEANKLIEPLMTLNPVIFNTFCIIRSRFVNDDATD